MTKKYFFFLILLLSFQCYSQNSILIDGSFSDWEEVSTTVVDAPEFGVEFDLLQFQVTNDEDYLYIHFEIDTEIQLMGDLFVPSIFLYLDTDNNSTTGYDAQDGYGTEVGIHFKQRFAYYNVTPYSTFGLNSISLLAAPTVTSNEFEIAILRESIPDNLNPLFPSNTIKIAIHESTGMDFVPSEGEVFTYEFINSPIPNYEIITFDKDDEDDIRILAYNTLFDGIVDPNLQDEYQRILQSINPNIIAFSECSSSSASSVKYRLDQWIPTSDPEGWYVEKDDYDLITASQWPIIESWPNIDRQFPTLIDLPSFYTRDLLLTNSHLKCCDDNEQRQLQVDEYAAFILDAKTPGGAITLEENTPIIYAGDLNLVGYGQQLNTLLTGEIQNTDIYGQGGFLDWDDTPNKDLIPAHSDQNFSFTWKNEFSDYTPSRIDYIIYSDAVIDVEKSFVLSTEEMSSDRLLATYLEENDTYYASDHYPVVMDFSIIENVNVSEIKIDNLKITPNPSTGIFYVSGLIIGSTLTIFDVYGRIIHKSIVSFSEEEVDLSGIDSGMYLLKTSHEKYSSTIKMVKE